jgi:hypothetical protein
VLNLRSLLTHTETLKETLNSPLLPSSSLRWWVIIPAYKVLVVSVNRMIYVMSLSQVMTHSSASIITWGNVKAFLKTIPFNQS